MSSVAAVVASLATLCAAGAIALWRLGVASRERAMAARFVERQIPADARSNAATSAARVENANSRVVLAATNLMRRAGVRNPRALVMTTLGVAACASLWAGSRAGAMFGFGIAIFVLVTIYAWLSWRTQKRHQKITRQLPAFLDGIVRLIVIGNSVPAAFQATLAGTEAPLRECLDRALPMLRTGMEIDHAMAAVARMYRVRELELVGSVLRVSVKYGGRSDVMLDRMAALMRDLEQADRELTALSTETRLSSWVLGLLPIVLGAAVIVMNPIYFNTMWLDPFGKRLVYLAIGLQMLGAWLLYRLARLRI